MAELIPSVPTTIPALNLLLSCSKTVQTPSASPDSPTTLDFIKTLLPSWMAWSGRHLCNLGARGRSPRWGAPIFILRAGQSACVLCGCPPSRLCLPALVAWHIGEGLYAVKIFEALGRICILFKVHPPF